MILPKLFECYAGDVTDIWEIGHRISTRSQRPMEYADLDVNYSCAITVAAPAPIVRPVTHKTLDGKRFRAWLTWQETAALPIGAYLVAVQIINRALVPELVKEVQFTLRILPQVVPNPI
jgi:hypothetical protein